MTGEPLVSIVIPCYNAASWLALTVDSARSQTWRNCEIIIVDDGSTDDSKAIAERLAGPNLRLEHQKNRGQCAALNLALRLAQGDFIQYLDADDLLAPNKISVQMARLSALSGKWIASGSWARFMSDPKDAVFESEAVWRDMDPVEWLATSWAGGGMMHGAAWLIPRKIVDAAGPWNEELTLINDLDYFTRLLLKSEGCAFCAEARTFYRSNVAGSLSRRTTRPAWISAFRATDLSCSNLLAAEDSERTRRASALNYQRLVHSAYPWVPDLVKAGERRIRELGGCDLRPGGGKVFEQMCRVLGWKAARRAQVFGRRLLRRNVS